MSDDKEKAEFAIGDAVQLKTGGPAMTVQDISLMTGEYQCVWFNGNIKQQSSFDGSILKEWVPPKDEDDLESYLDDDKPVWTPPKIR